ncbi:hypothetical protein G6F58_013826 [Rhizopus delemar]|nr:hypothetical protein G6F58_013826 [Rhizopus delemar]
MPSNCPAPPSPPLAAKTAGPGCTASARARNTSRSSPLPARQAGKAPSAMARSRPTSCAGARCPSLTSPPAFWKA